MKRMVVKFVPKLLNIDAELLKPVITGEETWIYGSDVKTKTQPCP